MKIAAPSVSVVLWFALLVPSIVSQYLREKDVLSSDTSSSMSSSSNWSRDHGVIRSLVESKRDLISLPTARVIVRYRTEVGRQQTLERASTTYHDFVNGTALVVELDPSSIIVLENQRKHIVSVERDDMWVEQGYLVEHHDPKVRSLKNQETPWGIKMVEATSVKVGAHPVIVCIVDTGAAKKHPDLPKGRT
jgi:hypothetical protein